MIWDRTFDHWDNTVDHWSWRLYHCERTVGNFNREQDSDAL